MLAYHNDPAVKAKYMNRVRAHRAADELIQGIGWEDGKGCAVGCTLEVYDHARYPVELGIPLELAHLEDQLFELQTREDAMAWPERFLESIRPGADLARVWPQWAVWMLEDPEHGVIRHAAGYPDCEAAIRRVAELWRTGGTPQQFRRAAGAARAAWAAARDAAWDAGAAARAAAEAAARAARAASAAWAAARAAAGDAGAAAGAAWAAWAAGAARAARAAGAARAARAAWAAAEAAWAAARAAAGAAASAASAAWAKAACEKLISLLQAA